MLVLVTMMKHAVDNYAPVRKNFVLVSTLIVRRDTWLPECHPPSVSPVRLGGADKD
jgi:hypothetical protein